MNEENKSASVTTDEAPAAETTTQASPDPGEASLTKDQIRTSAWLRFLLVWLLGLVVVGGLVRLTHSGMSIPDWPIIYYGPDKTQPSLLPPFNAASWESAYQTFHTEVVLRPGTEYGPREMGQFKREFWTEWAHRGLAKGFAILYLAVIVQVLRKPKLRKSIGGFLVGAGCLLAFQIILGGLVVRKHTPALHVSFHLLTAFIFVSLIAWAAMRVMRPEGRKIPPTAPKLTKLAWAAAIICLIQVFTGGLVANTKAGFHHNTWPLLGETLIPPAAALWQSHMGLGNLLENIILIQFVHRWLAFVVAAAVLILAAKLLFKPLSVNGRWALRAVVFTLGFQILLGIYTLLEAVPIVPAALHLGTGLVLYILLISLVYEVRTSQAIYALEVEEEERIQREIEAQLVA